MLALLDRNPLLRRVAPAVAAAVGLVVFTQLVLPGTPGGGRGTPMAILFQGAVRGLVVALTAAGVVLLYRTLRIVNFAQAALGIAGGVLCFALVQFTPVPFPLAFLLGLALSAVIGGGVGLFTLRFLQAPRLVLTVFTILLAAVVASFAGQVRQLPFLPDQAELSVADQLGADQVDAFLPFPGFTFSIGDTPLSFGFAEVFAIEMAVIALCALGAFFRFTRAGVAVRGLAENAERASLLGIGVGALSCAVWAIAGALSGAGVMLTGALVTPGSATGFAPGLLLPALAAAVIGRFTSLPVTIAAAVAIGVASAAADWSLTNERQSLVEVGLFAVVVVGLLVQRKGLQRSESSGGSSWQASDEQRPIPTELAGIRGLRLARRAAIGVGLVAVLLYPFVVSSGAQSLGGVIALSAIVVLSLVVLTGWAGQVSLGQYGFVAIGAVMGAALTDHVGLPFWFAVPIAAAVTAGAAAGVGIPALRVQGLLLLVATFAFGVMVRAALFQEAFFGWLLADDVQRPTLFLLDFDDERSMYFLCVGALVASIAVVVNLRRSRFGRTLIALRENEANVRAFGVSAVRTKLAAFAVSGGLAGFAGAIFVHQQTALSGDSYGVDASIAVFVTAVFGGVGSITGALIGAAYFAYVTYFFSSQLFQDVLQSLIPFYLLYTAPGGVVSVLVRVRDAGLRIVAQRRQIVVPSLFADYDPDLLARRLIPLGGPITGTGLAALGERRFALSSLLYKGRGERVVDTLAGRRPAADTAALAAAAAASAELESAGAGGVRS